MSELKKPNDDAYKVVSTFSGAGGSCLGLRMAGFRVLWANEIVASARDTYVANHPDTILDPRSIREISSRDILDHINLDVGELDLLEGSPPCTSFSIAGRLDKNWGKITKYSDEVSQRSDDLFF